MLIPPRVFRAACIAFGLLVCPATMPLARAVEPNTTWTGGGGVDSPYWGDTANWDTNAAPLYGTLTFSDTPNAIQYTLNDPGANANSMHRLLWIGTQSWQLDGFDSLSLKDYEGAQAKIENQGSGTVSITSEIIFAASNSTPSNPFGEINAAGGNISFDVSTLTVNGTSVNGIKFFGGSGHTVMFNNTVNAANKWFAITGSGTVNVGGAGNVTAADIYVMNGGALTLDGGGSLTTTAIRLGGDFGTTGNQDQTKGGTFALTASAGGQNFGATIRTMGGNTSGALLVNSQNTGGTNTLSGSIHLDSDLTIQNSTGGTLAITGAEFDIKSSTVTFNTGGLVSVTGAISSSTSAGILAKTGAGTLTLTQVAAYTGPTIVNEGTLNFGAGDATVQTLTSLAIGNSAVVKLTDHTGGSANVKAIATSLLAITGAATLDLGNNAAVVINNPDGSTQAARVAAIRALVNSGYNGGSWDGIGINSHTAAADALTNGVLAVMMYDNTQLGNSSFAGVTGLDPSGNQVLLKLTYLGDLNGDGIVDGSDYSLEDYYLSSALVAQGDLNADGVIDGADYSLMDYTLSFQPYGSLVAGGSPGLSSNGIQAVPEPATGALLLMGAIAAFAFRSKRKITKAPLA